jgi:hypothetical protein
MSKCLSGSIQDQDILPEQIVGPDDIFRPGREFLERLTDVASTEVEPTLPAPFRFATTPEALQANGNLIQDYGYDLERLFKDYQETALGYGSEFRPLDQLEKVLVRQPEFGVLSDLISNGTDYKFTKEVTEEERVRELRGMLERGNHKLTEKDSDKAAMLLAKDVAHGFSIPVSPETVEKISKGAIVQPLGLATQFAMAENGSQKIKHRLTQDLTFS